MRYFWKLFLWLIGWKAVNDFPHHIRRGIILVGPHTSGLDFVLGIAFRSTLGIRNAKYLGKKELFDGPFGFLFRWTGGTPVDRFSKQGVVDQVVEKFNTSGALLIALSPEGTRRRVDRLRSGFYYISKKANVPLILVSLDYKTKKLRIADPFYVSNDIEADFEKIIEYFSLFQGRYPEKDLHHLKRSIHNS